MRARGSGADVKLPLLLRIIADRGEAPLSRQARELAIPLSTAYRAVADLTSAGLVSPGRHGSWLPGFDLIRRAAAIDPRELLADIARSPLRRTAKSFRGTVHLGILEADMVTYLVKERGGGPEVLTRPGMQLEAYCSAIGKMLLASLPTPERDRYLAGGPFFALTPYTITDPEALRRELDRVRTLDHAIDEREISEALRCVAVPVRDRGGEIVAAISFTCVIPSRRPQTDDDVLAALRACAQEIEQRL